MYGDCWKRQTFNIFSRNFKRETLLKWKWHFRYIPSDCKK